MTKFNLHPLNPKLLLYWRLCGIRRPMFRTVNNWTRSYLSLNISHRTVQCLDCSVVQVNLLQITNFYFWYWHLKLKWMSEFYFWDFVTPINIKFLEQKCTTLTLDDLKLHLFVSFVLSLIVKIYWYGGELIVCGRFTRNIVEFRSIIRPYQTKISTWHADFWWMILVIWQYIRECIWVVS